MATSVLKTKYIPLYISVLVTTVVMALLFLRPDPAFGLTVVVDEPQNPRNQDPAFISGDAVVITAKVNLEGGLENIISAELGIFILTGPGAENFIEFEVPLPINEVTGDTVAIPQGTLVVDVKYTDVTLVPPANGYAYGYHGYQGGPSGGVITYTLTYTPPSISGFLLEGLYEASVTVITDQLEVTNNTAFVLVGPLTLPSVEAGIALGRTVIPGDTITITYRKTNEVRRVTVTANFGQSPGQPASGQIVTTREMINRTDFHPAILEKLDVPPEADLLLPFSIPEGVANNTTVVFTIETEDIAGQTVTQEVELTLSDSLSSFNVFLMPGFNFVTPALQCVNSTCSGDEYDIAALLAAQTVSRDKLNPAFLAEIPAVTGDVPLDKIVETVFAWDPVSDTFPAYTTSPSADTLLTMKAGNGYIIKSASINGVEPFKVFTGDFPQFDAGTEVPAPFKLTFDGTVIIDPGQSLPIHPVEPVWNLVGPHAERDTSVGVFLSAVSFPTRTWLALFEFNNTLEIVFDDDGDVERLDGGQVELLFVNRFNTLLGPDFGPQPAGDVVRAGSALWLLMCDGPAEECGGGLPPVLE